MSDHLCSNSLLNPFPTGHSTETALLEIVSNLLLSLDSGNSSVVTYLDLSAAFNTNDHILPSHLKYVFGIHGTALQWFCLYLSNKFHTVSINCSRSDPAPVSYGVPQGSVLRPVLFVLSTTPLSDVTEHHLILHHSFADDS